MALYQGGDGQVRAQSNYDGSILAGSSTTDSLGTSRFAFRWDQNNGIQNLGLLSGMQGSAAADLNADGSKIVGNSWISSGSGFTSNAFAWDYINGMQNLNISLGGSQTDVKGISEDGSLIIGHATDASGFTHAFLWNQNNGTTKLKDYLVTEGVDVGDWIALDIAEAISPDGSVVVGYGTYEDNVYHAFAIVGVPEPSSLSLLLAGGAVVALRRRR